MKKNTKYSILFVLILFGMILVGITGGKETLKDFIEKAVRSIGQYTDRTTDIIDLDGKKISDYSKLEIKASSSKIRLIASADEFLHVEYPGNKSKTLTALVQGPAVQFNLTEYLNGFDGKFVFRIFNTENKINLTRLDHYQTTFSIPKSIKIISIKSEAGDIVLDSLTEESVQIRSVSSQIKLHNIVVDKLNVNLVSGDLKTEGLISSGEIETVSGHVHIENKNNHPNLKIASISGSIQLYFLTEPDAKLDFESVSGLLRMDADHKISKMNSDSETKDFSRKKVITLGHGKGSLKLSTISGAVHVRQMKPSEEKH